MTTRKQLLRQIAYYGIDVDASTKKFIKERLHSISQDGDTYEIKEFIPCGGRAYRGTKIYAVYNAIQKAKEARKQELAERRDMRKNPDAYITPEQFWAMANTVGVTGVANV